MADLRSNRDKVISLVSQYQRTDPRFAEIIRLLADDIHSAITTLSPIAKTVASIGLTGDPPDNVLTVLVSLNPTAIQIAWTTTKGAQLYEIREGTVWTTGTFILRTPSLSAALNPRIVGTYSMMIKAISAGGVESVLATHFSIIIPAIGNIILSAQVVDNNVLLSWTIPSSVFQLDHYNAYVNGVKFGESGGNFLTRFEAASGTFFYEIEAQNIVGDLSPRAGINVTVNEPPDFVLQDVREVDMSLTTNINCKFSEGKLYACIDIAETFDNHFINAQGGGADIWETPQEQVTEGYERWIQNNPLTGSLENTHNYGVVISNIIAVVNFIKETFSGTSDVTASVKLAWSLDGITYTPFTDGATQFIDSLQYLKTRIEFSAPNDDAMIALSQLFVRLNVKRETDAGSGMAFSTDVDGTVFFFNKTFKDIDSITATPDQQVVFQESTGFGLTTRRRPSGPLTAIVDFKDVPNPTQFKVLVFDSAGQRATNLISWVARGVV